MSSTATAPTQTELRTQGQALKGAQVLFDNNGRTAVGTVIAFSICGGSPVWKLQLIISYRGGQYARLVRDVAL